MELLEQERRRLQGAKESGSTLRLLDEVFSQPFMTAPLAASLLGVSPQGARNILEKLVEHGVLRTQPGSWPRLYIANGLLELLEAGKPPVG